MTTSSPTQSPLWSGVSKYLLLIFLVLAFLLRVTPAPSANLAHPDEIFQTQEPAHRLAYGYGVVTWEWREGIRSWVFPAFLACVMRATSWMGEESSGYLLGIRLMLSLISLSAVWFAFSWAKRASGTPAAFIAAGCCATWYQLVDFGGRALTEVVAAHLLLPGLYLGVYGDRIPERERLILAGAFCGLALSLRIQLMPAVAFALLGFCGTRWQNRILPVGAGLAVPIVVFGIVDWFTWSYPFHSFIRYFWLNAIEGRSKAYGVEPWNWYLLILVETLGPMLVFALVGVRRCLFLGGVALTILVSHSVIGHKEVRFVYPMIPILLTLAAIGIADIAPKVMLCSRPSSGTLIIVGLTVSISASTLLAPQFPYWEKDTAGILAFDQLRNDSSLCGVGLYGQPWYDTGGYTHLHREVPIIPVLDVSGLETNATAFNALIAPAVASDLPRDFRLMQCWNGVCLYKRLGFCTPPRIGSELNAYLQRTNN